MTISFQLKEDLVILKGLMNSVRAARSRYQSLLDNAKKSREAREESEKAKKKKLRETLVEKVHYRFFNPKDPKILHRIEELFARVHKYLLYGLFYIIKDLMREPYKCKHYDLTEPYFSKVHFCTHPVQDGDYKI